MHNVYLINLSTGLAGIERRFANIWQTLRARGNVRPILVVPDTLASLLHDAGLVDGHDDLLWTVPESPWLRTSARVRLPPFGNRLVTFTRSRALARAYRPVWDRIRADPSAILHIGMNCSALIPPDAPIVYECVDSTLTQLGTRHYRRAATRPSVIHCQTDRIRQALEQTMADRDPRWITATSPCYFARYPERCSEGPPRDRTLVAFVGRLASEKNPLLFVDALARVHQSGVPCRGLILGEGPMLADVRGRVRQLGLDSIVDIEFSQRAADRLVEAAVYVTLQTGDNYGSQSLLEAMGAGCAIVATAVGETARVVTPDVGVLVNKDSAELAAAIVRLLGDPERAAMMGRAACRRVRSEYTADAYAAFLESLYARAVDAHRSRTAPGR